jgi:hypothetical protein
MSTIKENFKSGDLLYGLMYDQTQCSMRRVFKELDSNITVHFVLDDIDIRDVFVRVDTVRDDSCASELRYVLKNYEEIKQRIKFYHQDQEIDLFSWLMNDRSAEARTAMMKWAQNKNGENKLDHNTLQRLAVAMHKVIHATTDVSIPHSPMSSRSGDEQQRLFAFPPSPTSKTPYKRRRDPRDTSAKPASCRRLVF